MRIAATAAQLRWAPSRFDGEGHNAIAAGTSDVLFATGQLPEQPVVIAD
jgi:hypothetical protein